ncbi:hypothetical protein GBF38_001625 [Nibea albiflora]|uniref:Uncharacterized protein n=1 Tax=Nibea albiflora TaxID=240163 RepID=A0ACB7ETX5_NIBAL|nr:hypothetical protein GBF38_001625 [Nibea albiflora]
MVALRVEAYVHRSRSEGPLKLIIGLSQLRFLREEMEKKKKKRSRLEGGEDPAFGVHPALTGLPTAGKPLPTDKEMR